MTKPPYATMKKMLGLLVMFCISLQGVVAEDPKGTGTVDLTFAWPEGLRLSVKRSFSRRTEIGSKNEELHSEGKYLWSLERSGAEYRIVFSEFDQTIAEPPLKSRDPVVQLEYVSRKIDPLLPTLVVDSNAQPIRFEKLDELKARVEEEIKELRGLKDREVQQFLKILLNDQTFQVRAVEDWNRMIQVWSGHKGAEIGGSFQTAGVTGSAAGEPIENLFLYSVDHGPLPNTVQLMIVQKPKKEQMKMVLDTILGGDARKLLQLPDDAEFAFENRFTTVCDPSTLIPITYTKTKLWGGHAGKDRKFKGRVDTWFYTFSVIKDGKK
jgi:hypothetical protein